MIVKSESNNLGSIPEHLSRKTKVQLIKYVAFYLSETWIYNMTYSTSAISEKTFEMRKNLKFINVMGGLNDKLLVDL